MKLIINYPKHNRVINVSPEFLDTTVVDNKGKKESLSYQAKSISLAQSLDPNPVNLELLNENGKVIYKKTF